MITISLCMIVKNEEGILGRCLDSIADLMDELVVVDTGSTDATKEVAKRYGAKLYDFAWIDDFSAARNFAFSKAACDYIYSADADEVLTEENREKFRLLKASLLPEIEIVQMKYANQLQFGAVYNFDEEYRPKLFKRKRDFVWEAPIHETIRLTPLVYDSDIVIEHLAQESHAKRDLKSFARHCKNGYRLSRRLHNLYARELMIAGDEEDFQEARGFFEAFAADLERSGEEIAEACCVVAKAARLADLPLLFFQYAMKVVAGEANSEICCELGHFYEEQKDYVEAAVWYYNGAFETQPILNIHARDREPLEGLIRCYRQLGEEALAQEYEKRLEEAKS